MEEAPGKAPDIIVGNWEKGKKKTKTFSKATRID